MFFRQPLVRLFVLCHSVFCIFCFMQSSYMQFKLLPFLFSLFSFLFSTPNQFSLYLFLMFIAHSAFGFFEFLAKLNKFFLSESIGRLKMVHVIRVAK